jgi:hypothetical protein
MILKENDKILIARYKNSHSSKLMFMELEINY